MRKELEDRTALLCDDCEVEIFTNVNMLMVHDELWKKIISLPPKKITFDDALCDCCMEKRLGRPITRSDWRVTYGAFAPCNIWSEQYRIDNPSNK